MMGVPIVIPYSSGAGSGGASLRYKNYVHSADLSAPPETSISLTIPSDTAEGDLIVACLLHRDTLTPPSGFTLAASVTQTEGTTQYSSIYYKIAGSGDAGSTCTFNHASSSRIAMFLVTFFADGSAGVNTYNTATNTSTPLTFPSVTATADGGICVLLCTDVYNGQHYVIDDGGWFNIDCDMTTYLRVCVGVIHCDSGSVTSAAIYSSSSSPSTGQVSVVFVP